MPLAMPIKVVFAAKITRGLTTNSTAYLGFIEVAMGQMNFRYHAANGIESQEVGI